MSALPSKTDDGSGSSVRALQTLPRRDIKAEAAGNLALLLSVIRCREVLSNDEEENVLRVIRELREIPDSAATPGPRKAETTNG